MQPTKSPFEVSFVSVSDFLFVSRSMSSHRVGCEVCGYVLHTTCSDKMGEVTGDRIGTKNANLLSNWKCASSVLFVDLTGCRWCPRTTVAATYSPYYVGVLRVSAG